MLSLLWMLCALEATLIKLIEGWGSSGFTDSPPAPRGLILPRPVCCLNLSSSFVSCYFSFLSCVLPPSRHPPTRPTHLCVRSIHLSTRRVMGKHKQKQLPSLPGARLSCNAAHEGRT